MNLAKQQVVMLVAGLVIGTTALVYLGVNTGALSNINETDISEVLGAVTPNDLEAEQPDIINLGG